MSLHAVETREPAGSDRAGGEGGGVLMTCVFDTEQHKQMS